MICAFCLSENEQKALVCGSCGRDIAIPDRLIAERDDLLRKRDTVQRDLLAAKAELDALRQAKKSRRA